MRLISYTAILKTNPKHPDANHKMGVLTFDNNKPEVAIRYFKTALEENPKIEDFWLSYIDCLIKLDRMTEAKAVFDQAKKIILKKNAFDPIEKELKPFHSKIKYSSATSRAIANSGNLTRVRIRGCWINVLNSGVSLICRSRNINGATDRAWS